MVSSEIARRVTAAADSLGYRPNPIAYGLRTNHSFTIGVLIPDLTNPVFPPIIRGIEDTLNAEGYTAIVANTDNDRARELLIVERMRARSVDGLIFATAQRNDPLVAECTADELPLVLINRAVDDEAVACVANDDVAGIHQIVDHLAGLGHRRIAHIAGPQHVSTAFDRQRAFLDALAERGLARDPAPVVPCKVYSEDAGRAACEELLALAPEVTAVVAANDLLALGCYDALAARGIDCPREMSVTGYNDMPFMAKLRPPLTTVRTPHYRMGAEAGRILIARMNGECGPARPLRLTPELIVRGSTAAPRGG